MVAFISGLGPELQTILASVLCSIALAASAYLGTTVVALLVWLERHFIGVGIGPEPDAWAASGLRANVAIGQVRPNARTVSEGGS